MLIDVVYMIVKEGPPAGVAYSRPGMTAKEAWNNAMRDDFGACYTRESAKKRGWRAKRVEIRLADGFSLEELREEQGRG